MPSLARTIDPEPRSAAEFLHAYADVEGRFEYVDGRVRPMMTEVTWAHYKVANRFIQQLAPLLQRGYVVGGADFGVQIGEDVRFPDILVQPDDLEPTARRTIAPVLVGEVLSKSTSHIDFGAKVQQHTSLATLLHYVVLSQDEPAAWLWSRDVAGAFGPPEIVTGSEAILALNGFDLSVPLSVVYR